MSCPTCSNSNWYYVIAFKSQTALETGFLSCRQKGIYVESLWIEADRFALIARPKTAEEVEVLTSLEGILDCIKRRDFESD